MTNTERIQFLIDLLRLEESVVDSSTMVYKIPTFKGGDRDKLKAEVLSLLMIK